MKGDISADFHAPVKRYTGVRGQQGRVLTDADFNAAFDTMDDALEGLVRSLICSAGSPDGGFDITAPDDENVLLPDGVNIDTINFNIAPGSFVLGGKVLTLADVQTFLDQDDWLSHPLDAAEYPDAPTILDLAALPDNERYDLVYLEMITQAVRAVEDREIQERALGGADTTTRVRPQLRFRVYSGTVDECVAAADGLRAELAGAQGHFSDDGTELLSDARLAITFTNDPPAEDPCAPREIAGYLCAENQMLKVMLTAADRFVWAFDHGEPLYRVVVDEATSEIQFLTEPRDPVLYPRPGQVIEILPWDVLLPNREKAAAPTGHLSSLTSEYNPASARIGFATPLPAGYAEWLANMPEVKLSDDDENQRYFYARIWEEPPSGGGAVDEPVGANVVLPGTGLALNFLANGFVGDYWSAALRPDTPELIVPWALQDAAGAPPAGPRRFYAPLALFTWRDVEGAVAGSPHDCRNRFSRLCQIKDCCTYQVGDGRVSFGEFNDIQDAIDALPDDGGEICLLPGRHEGVIHLDGLRDIRINGCGPRTIVAPAPGESEPVFTITGGENILLESFDIEHDDGLAVSGEASPTLVTLRHLGVRVTGSAIVFTSSNELTIERCTIRSSEFANPLDASTVGDLRPLLYVHGRNVRVRGNLLEAATDSGDSSRYALGGMQIAGGSDGVEILDNRITGGSGDGIILGSVVTDNHPVDNESGGYSIPPAIIVDANGCIMIEPGDGTITDPAGTVTVVVSEGPVVNLRIRNNDIVDMGMNGITTAYWFIPSEDGDAAVDDDMEIENVVIAENTIRRCMQLGLAGSLPLEQAFAAAFGGIVLSGATDLQIEDNDIRDCGGTTRTPICGIYVRYGEMLHIVGNRIYDNGRAATQLDPLLVGNIGGIVIAMVEAGLDTLGDRLSQHFEAQPRAPALFVKDNVVVSPEGRALDVTGTGPMLIEGNSLTCYGNNGLTLLIILFIAIIILLYFGVSLDAVLANEDILGQFEAFKAQLGGSAVSVINQGMAENIVLIGRKASEVFSTDDQTAVVGGEVQFSDNIVTFDALSGASTLSLCSVLLMSTDDVAMHDNQSTVEARNDFIVVNTIALGFLSLRVQGNRFKESLPRRRQKNAFPITTLLSAVTAGFMNATENNQGTHCFLRIGVKKPRVFIAELEDGQRAILDTNRNIITDQLCNTFYEMNYIDGTEAP